MTDSDLEQTDSLKDTNTFNAANDELLSSSDPSNQIGSVSFDETNLLLLKKYRDWEETLKLEYYKSNPLRNYVSSIYGQSILPVRSSHSNKKKSLPKIFNDLRITENFQQDRELHKRKLCTSLNINLDSLDVLNRKNPIDMLEESKKIYSEYCKYNLTKPIDLTNVESILKANFLKKSDTSSNHYDESNQGSLSSRSSSQNSLNSNLSSSLQTNEEINQNKRVETRYFKEDYSDCDNNLNINARQAKINDLNEINQDIKEHKKKLAQTNLGAHHLKHNYRIVDSARSNRNKQKLNQVKPKYYQHKGSIYNYRNRNKLNLFKTNNSVNEKELNNDELEQINKLKSQVIRNGDYHFDDRENTVALNAPKVSVNNLSCFGSELCFKSNLNLYNEHLNNTTLLNQNEKRLRRVQNARDKILNDTNEKTNLNKMTILQPFEDTKILINIDKVSSKILNSLLNKHNTVPRYYMPPIKSFGYFKKVITNDPASLLNSNICTAINNPNQTYLEHSNKHTHKLESLKSLSEQHSKAPTFYYDDELDMSKYKENSVLSMLNHHSSAIKSETSLANIDPRTGSSNKGIST